MTDQTITIVGARGGSGTSTVASAAALFASRTVTTELVSPDLDDAAALLGISAPATPDAPIDIADGLTLTSATTDTAHVVVVDAGQLDQLTESPVGLVLLVLRGPCYLGLRSIVASGLQADGIVLLVEPGRSLTRRDIRDVCGLPVVAEIPVTANIARTIDAGLLIGRLPAQRAFTDLCAYIDTTVNRTEPQRASRERHPSSRSAQSSTTTSASSIDTAQNIDHSATETPSKIDTDLPVPLAEPAEGARAPRGRVATSAQRATEARGLLVSRCSVRPGGADVLAGNIRVGADIAGSQRGADSPTTFVAPARDRSRRPCARVETQRNPVRTVSAVELVAAVA